ncbi:MAG: DUF5906 domain-containing protein, partial [Ignavibacteria bacterium]|nr:DUF5906 domain-containing protein [Ignavibacteria bacterium]
QYMDFLTRLVGEHNTTTTDLEMLMKSRFESAKLYKKKLALIGETNFSIIKDTAKIKKITGSDMVSGEFKQKKPFDFFNTAKVIISSNSVPESIDKTDAFYRRIIILEFKNKFTVEVPIIDTIPEFEYENFIFYVLEHILSPLLARGSFKNEGTIEQKAEKYEKLSDPFSTFKERELIEDIDSDIPLWVLRDLYTDFCTHNNFRKLGDKEFTQTLNRADIETKKRRFGAKTWNAAIGFRTKNPRVWDITDSNNVPLVPLVPGDMIRYNTYSKEGEPSGTSGTCGTNEIVKKIKEKYDYFNKPDSILDLGRLQKNMERYLLTELEGSEEVYLMGFIEDYCKARGWS